MSNITAIAQSLRETAKTLITKHVQVQTILENVETDEDFENLSPTLMAAYREAEDAFLQRAESIGQHCYSVDYHGTPFLIRCCDDFEEVQIDRLVALEAA